MSHIVSVQTEVRDADAIWSACHHLRLNPPIFGSFCLFRSTVTGVGVRLPTW